MATTDVDLANLALSHLGDDATVSQLDPPEGSVQAEHCARFLPIVRGILLELHPWKFATRRVIPALRADLANSAWGYVYQEPNGMIRVLSVLPEGYTRDSDGGAVAFDCESDDEGNGLILTNTPNATVRGIFSVVDPVRFSPLFTDALSWLLASYIAGPLLKGETGAAEAVRCWQVFLQMFARATGSNANQAHHQLQHLVPWIADRGVTPVGWAELGPVRG
jgi:hypothetical protein